MHAYLLPIWKFCCNTDTCTNLDQCVMPCAPKKESQVMWATCNSEFVVIFTFKTIAFLNALSHIVHWWLLSPWTLRIWLPSECLFCSTFAQIGQLAKVSWCRFRCFRRLSSCFNLKQISLQQSNFDKMYNVLTKRRTHCIAFLVGLLLNVPACDLWKHACFWILEHKYRKRVRTRIHERLECVMLTLPSTQNWKDKF